jgi:DnaK suppressor protein
MDSKTLEHFKNLFTELKHTQLSEIETTELAINGGGDEVESAWSERERELGLKLQGRQLFFLRKIENALERIKCGTFGECEECDSEIELGRLMARPTATMCISCKEAEERGEDHIPYQRKSHTLGKELFAGSGI